MADLETGRPQPTAERLDALLDTLAPHARALGCAAELAAARGLVEANGAARQREAAGPDGAFGATRWLTDRFTG